jgi:hypothetical protein
MLEFKLLIPHACNKWNYHYCIAGPRFPGWWTLSSLVILVYHTQGLLWIPLQVMDMCCSTPWLTTNTLRLHALHPSLTFVSDGQKLGLGPTDRTQYQPWLPHKQSALSDEPPSLAGHSMSKSSQHIPHCLRHLCWASLESIQSLTMSMTP